MVNYQLVSSTEQSMDLIFQSLADPTRRKILERLLSTPLTVSEIAEPYRMSLPAVSKHLKVLERAQLINRVKKGREHTIQINPATFTTVSDYISFYTKFWNTKFAQLESFLTHQSSLPPTRKAGSSKRIMRENRGDQNGR